MCSAEETADSDAGAFAVCPSGVLARFLSRPEKLRNSAISGRFLRFLSLTWQIMDDDGPPGSSGLAGIYKIHKIKLEIHFSKIYKFSVKNKIKISENFMKKQDFQRFSTKFSNSSSFTENERFFFRKNF